MVLVRAFARADLEIWLQKITNTTVFQTDEVRFLLLVSPCTRCEALLSAAEPDLTQMPFRAGCVCLLCAQLHSFLGLNTPRDISYGTTSAGISWNE